MTPRRRWAGIASLTGLVRQPDPHFASAAAIGDGWHIVSSILPRQGCGDRVPGRTTHERRLLAAQAMELAKPQIWGGDFNHACEGKECVASRAGRAEIQAVVGRLGLAVPTADLPHHLHGC